MQTALWGPEAWNLLNFTAKYVGRQSGKIPEAVAKSVSAMRGVLPCTFCRASFDAFISTLEDRFKAKLVDLPASLFPRFVYELHELVNDKLDTQHCEKSSHLVAQRLSAQLGIPEPELASMLHQASVESGAFRGRRITYETFKKRLQLTSAQLSPHSVLDLLFVLALNYPEELTQPELTAQQLLSGVDAMSAKDRRALYWQWFTTLPAALKAAGMRCSFPDVLTQVWGACTQTTCPAYVKNMPEIVQKLRALFQSTIRDHGFPTKELLFSMVAVVRGMYTTDACMHNKQAWQTLRKQLKHTYDQMRAGRK